MRELNRTKEISDYGKVGVLLGGNSAEREISLLSGEAIYQSLIRSGVDAVKIDPAQNLQQQLLEHEIDRALIALHGRDGEDGVIQGYLKTCDIPFTGSDVCGAALSMNKLLSKRVWREAEIPTARFAVVNKNETFDEVKARRLFAKLGTTLFVKPVKEGSSVGMSKVTSAKELVDGVAVAHQYDDDVLVESFINGREYTVSILNGVALPSISMVTPRDFYDYKAKYQSQQTQYFCPSGLSDNEENELQNLALNAFSLLGCSGWGRVDFIRDGDKGEFLILEANTVPGMTETSLVPKSALVQGLSFDELVLLILETSFMVNKK